jgi:PTS system nitrogen regulatory IIA component
MISLDLVIPSVSVGSKKQLFDVVAAAVADAYKIDADALVAALIAREKIGTTGIGDGAALPHIKVQGIDRIFCVLARLEQPVDYDAIDQKPVDIVYLVLAPAEAKTTTHLKILAQAARFLKEKKFQDIIRHNADPAFLETLVNQWSAEQDVREIT